jgi:2'-5' RNA ligase
MARLFIGIFLPESIQLNLLSMLPDDVRLRPAMAGQLHLTLHFLGELSDNSMVDLSQSLSALQCASFKLVLAGAGVFQQDGGRRGVLWAGILPCEPLRQLHGTVSAVIQNHGLPLEDRPWAPHITLARYSSGPPEHLKRFLNQGTALNAELDVREFQLVQSQPGPNGSVYTSRAVFPLC